MVLCDLTIQHNGTSHRLDFDSDDGFEVLKFQVFSLTLVSPENQIFFDSSSKEPVSDEVDLLNRSASANHMYTLTLVENAERCTSHQTLAELEKADEALARLLQAEEETHFLQLQSGEEGRGGFAARIDGHVNQVLQYEDPFRQEKARATVQQCELEERAVVLLAMEGKRNPTRDEIEHHMLFQLLMWFKKSFRWVNAAPCLYCGAETTIVGMGMPNSEDLQYGADHVELHRCRTCQKITRFPRYNDSLKLLETRSGRCGEWANCFTLYCRAFGYDARLVLDFTDHVWTECFSNHFGRWVHLDPCEGAFDKPLLYEEGWGKKLNYLIALSKDGIFDVTRRYTRNWEEVRLRRTITTEENIAAVILSITSRLRNGFTHDRKEWLRIRDEKEAQELALCERNEQRTEALPGRSTGTEEWRKSRGEFGNSASSSITDKTASPRRACLDKHVSKVLGAIGEISKVNSASNMLHGILDFLLHTFKKLKETPYMARKVQIALEPLNSSVVDAVHTDAMQVLFCLLALELSFNSSNEEISITTVDPIDTALALPVLIINLEALVKAVKNGPKIDAVLNRITFLSEHERICGAWTQASGEESPLGIATSAFDGLQYTKWEEPNGAKGCWLAYYLASDVNAEVVIYELTAANDCPERDPKEWVLEGSKDYGCTWMELDTRKSVVFSNRYERKSFQFAPQRRSLCNAFRLRFLAVRDSSSQSRLQLSCVDFFTKK